ncbi:MAG: hypothetical protein KKD28_09415 [Chloroflexi bacterium]|nr:hypothetical protein [Chloroflexota bacterium]MBU1661677.1 hypothetical protein [Chloroflexota bacterium]
MESRRYGTVVSNNIEETRATLGITHACLTLPRAHATMILRWMSALLSSERY